MSDTLSIDRAAINRENSLKSTGPKSDAGKQKSSLNALRHGLTGQTIVMPCEDLAEYQRYTQVFHDDLKPVGALEIHSVQSIADDHWRLDRTKALETNLLTYGAFQNAHAINTEHPEVRAALAVTVPLDSQSKALAILSMHQNRIARTIERTVNQLHAIQAERRQREEIEMAHAAKLYLLHAQQNNAAGQTEPYQPAVDGFVLTVAEIELHLGRAARYAEARNCRWEYSAAA